MAQNTQPRSDANFPLPPRQFRGYIYFFTAITFGAYAGALGTVLWMSWGNLGWREALFTLLILAQFAIYIGVLMLNPKKQLTGGVLATYFIGSIGIWVIEVLLVPRVYWLGFVYMGQMFGMLPSSMAILGTAFVSLVMILFGIRFDFSQMDLDEIFGLSAGWLSMIMLLLYVNHLIRTSRERGKLIDELQQAQQQLEAARQKESELAVLRERERLARDLHDSLGHTLVALSVQLEAIQRLYRVDPEGASAQMDELKTLTRASMEDLRRSLAGLRSPGLGDRSLTNAIRALCLDFCERTGVEITCDIDEHSNELSPAVTETLWRVAQESLTNVEKHAQARCVKLIVGFRDSSMEMSVKDDGVGLPQNADKLPDRFGLRGMRERVEGLGGKLDLKNTDPGTLVRIFLPLSRVEEENIQINRAIGR